MIDRLRRVLREEDGLEALQVVMIVAIAAVCLVLLKTWWPVISAWFSDAVDIVIE